MTSAKNAADPYHPQWPTRFWIGAEGGLARDAFDMAAAAARAGRRRWIVIAALAAGERRARPESDGAVRRNQKREGEGRRAQRRRSGRSPTRWRPGAKTGAPDGNARPTPRGARPAPATRIAKCAAARKDLMKKHASGKAAAHTAAPALAVAKKAPPQERTPRHQEEGRARRLGAQQGRQGGQRGGEDRRGRGRDGGGPPRQEDAQAQRSRSPQPGCTSSAPARPTWPRR